MGWDIHTREVVHFRAWQEEADRDRDAHIAEHERGWQAYNDRIEAGD